MQRIPVAELRFSEQLARRFIAEIFYGLLTSYQHGSDVADPRRYVVAHPPSPDDVQFAKVKRGVVKLQSIADLPTCLENDVYYTPKVSISRSMMSRSGPRPFREVDHFVGPPDNNITISWRFGGAKSKGLRHRCDIEGSALNFWRTYHWRRSRK